MFTGSADLLLDEFMAAAEAAAPTRPDIDLEIAREVLGEAATMLHDGLALDHLDEHDYRAAATFLGQDLVAPDPAAAVRARALTTLDSPGDLHDPQGVSAACLVVASLFRL